MATQAFSKRTLIEHVNDTGESPTKSFDETLTLSGFEEGQFSRRLNLAPAGADVDAGVPADALAVHVHSHDYPFKVRLAGGETLLSGLRDFGFTADDTDETTGIDQILLSGNGTNVAHLEITYVVKPS